MAIGVVGSGMALSLPSIGLRTSRNDDPEECAATVASTLETGYQHVDTAQMYGNEAAVGGKIERADAPREGCIVATTVAPKRLDGTDGKGIDRERRLIDSEDNPW